MIFIKAEEPSFIRLSKEIYPLEKVMIYKNTHFTDIKISELFNKFLACMIHPCETESQKDKAVGIAKILWLLLITGKDTEENIYIALKSIFHDHDATISFGSLYYYKMKKSLTNKELKILEKHYKISENINSLEGWDDTTFANKLH